MSSPANRVAWPFYLALDVSKSMWRHGTGAAHTATPWEAMRDGLPDLLFALEESPTAADITHLTIVAFCEEVLDYLPRTRIADGHVTLPKLPQGTQTDYAKLFTHLGQVIRRDVAQLTTEYSKVKRPVIFMITDGEPVVGSGAQPESDWVPPLDDVHGITVRDMQIAVVSLGFGNVKEATLARIAQAPGVACVAESQDASPGELVTTIMEGILDSMLLSLSVDELEFAPPQGMRQLQ